jgi:type IV secretory pathway VirB3-like protein
MQSKIEMIAKQAGVSAEDRLNLETLLTALPRRERRRVRLFWRGSKLNPMTPPSSKQRGSSWPSPLKHGAGRGVA